MKIRREWGWPTSKTFRCPPIGGFVNYYLNQSKISIDPFARNFTGATYTNDLNPKTKAQYHMDSVEFLKMIKAENIRPDLVIFDPPYSPRQLKECYNSIGKDFITERENDGTVIKGDANRTWDWSTEKNIINEIMDPGAIFLHFGWTSQGMGLNRKFKIIEILLVCHGVGSNDTICMAERKTSEQLKLF